MQTYFLIEDFNPAFDYRGGISIPLNPLPLYELSKRKIPYKIMEDFYSERELRAKEPEFFLEELAWIDSWDALLQKEIPFIGERRLALARSYYNRIKFFVNALIIQAFILHRVVKGMGSQARIVYISKHRELQASRKTMHDFKYDESALCFPHILPAICKSYGVPYQFETFESAVVSESKVAPKGDSFEGVRAFAKRLYHFLKLKKWNRTIIAQGQNTALNVLFLHSGSLFYDPILEDMVQRGATVFARYDEKITEVSDSTEPLRFDFAAQKPDSVDREIEAHCRRLAEGLAEHPEGRELLAWVNAQCGVDVSSFVLPYFQAFLAINCSELLFKARCYERFYRECGTDYIVTHTNSDHHAKSAILGAQIHGGVKTVCLQHCCDPFIDRVMHLTEIDAFDYYFTTDDMSEKKYKDYARMDYVSPCKVYQSPHFLKAVEARAGKNKATRSQKPYRKILYIPTKLSAIHTRYFNCMSYPILWYLEFQKQLFDHFSKLPQYQFFYKQPMIRTRFIKETVVPYLEEKNYSNISIETRPVMDSLTSVDAVILDRPTTAFFETLMSGLPVLALYPDFVSNMYDPESFRLFGKPFQSFASSEEACRKIDDFLSEEPESYTPKLRLSGDPIFEVLLNEKSSARDTVELQGVKK